MRKILFTAIVMLIFFLSSSNFSMAYEREIKSISSALAENIAREGKKMIAVVDFTDLQGNVTELGRFLAEEFSVAFAGAGKGFEVVDRTHLKSILAEHKLSTTGLIDPQTARKLGQIAGVDALITGTITPFGDSIRLSVKVLDTATAKVISASSGDIAKTKAIEELLARGIETSPAIRQEPASPSAPSYLPSSGKSKRVGDMIVTMKRIVVSKGQVTVALDLFNQSNKELKIAIPWDGSGKNPQLIDEKGNIFQYQSGIPQHRLYFDEGFKAGQWLTLNPKLNNDVVIYFYPKQRDIDIKEIGSNFSFFLKYTVFNPDEKKPSDYSVSLTDISAQKPK